jgi:hypothetical protein
MKNKTLFIAAAFSIAIFAAGCSTMEHALLTPSQTVTPAVTNIVAVVSTNAAGVVSTNLAQVITPAVINTTYAPSTLAQGTLKFLEALPIPGAAPAAIFGGWALSAFAGWKSRQKGALSVALVKGIEAGRQILQSTPEGQRLDQKFKDVLIDNQEVAGVLNAAGKLVNQYTGDTVKPVQ